MLITSPNPLKSTNVRALALEEGKVKTLDLVSTAEARATILEARLADNSIVSTDCLR